MLVTAALLAIVAVLLAWPVPIVLARAEWPARAPALALALWQLVAITGGLSMVGAPLALALAAFGDHPAAALAGAGEAAASGRPLALPLGSVVGLIVATLIAGYLLGTLAATLGRVSAQRRRHHALLALLSEPHPDLDRTRVLDDAAPVAYCLPRGLGTLTVLSRGLVDHLPADELAAVIAHEQAHLSQRHDIVLVAFRAWHAALPGFPVAALAEQRVAVLIEMLADDHARRATDDTTLARAILHVAENPHLVGGDERVAAGPHPTPAPDNAGTLTERLGRLAPVG
jgi:Zn-dependent protease with chaperone function